MDKIDELVYSLIRIKDRMKTEGCFSISEIDAISEACNLIYHHKEYLKGTEK